jgi:hypothetical protein
MESTDTSNSSDKVSTIEGKTLLCHNVYNFSNSSGFKGGVFAGRFMVGISP